MSELKIVYAIDDNVYKLAAVSIASVLLNNKNHDIEIIILNSNLCQKAIDEYNKLKKIKDFTLTVVHVDEQEFKGLPNAWLTVTAWFRLKMAVVCPNIDKALYLDCDTICRRDLSYIWNQEFDNKSVFVTEEYMPQMLSKLNLQSKWYFNSGVMLCNLAKWREKNLTPQLISCAFENKNIIQYLDQDICNIFFDKDKKKFVQDSVFLTYDKPRPKNPVIIHFTGPKPFKINCGNIYKKEWWKYAKYTSFYNEFKNCCDKEKLKFLQERILSFKNTGERIRLYFLGIKISFKKRV